MLLRLYRKMFRAWQRARDPIRYARKLGVTVGEDCRLIALTDATFGSDDLRRTRVILQFAPETHHLDIDASIKNILVNPGSLQQMLARQRPLRRFEERQQQRILALAQRDRRPIGIE